MTQHGLAILALALSATVAGASAQAPRRPTSDETVLRGCLREARADTSAANTKGIIYTLEIIEATLPTSPAPEGSSPIRPSVTRYALSFDKSVDVSTHVDHRVEVKGRERHMAAPDKPLPGAAEHLFDVSTVTMISPNCK